MTTIYQRKPPTPIYSNKVDCVGRTQTYVYQSECTNISREVTDYRPFGVGGGADGAAAATPPFAYPCAKYSSIKRSSASGTGSYRYKTFPADADQYNQR